MKCFNENMKANQTIRADERHLCSRIRQSIPLNQKPADIDRYNDKLETECKEVEEHDSHKFL